ncbi:hypothetical protein NB717_003218 [Xanthomonas sacchari]|nr:hypothetical protein [Xanthomonas sacchari]MCW0462150.1 hypothetical protein [Xanthomonas sacchari]MCW0465019.1 hypothetical protein [Xanthomonas sacchari]
MPLTCGRTSDSSEATVRPANSTLSGTLCGCRVTTSTVFAAGAGALPPPLQPANASTTTDSSNGSARRRWTKGAGMRLILGTAGRII